ncbi:response regulator [Cohnella rhizosphaerae]|uniref:Response regulator n=1 Tax=Cohnella rhizosphaerae TaxID=1457232 RepID=A0A9X4QSR1_9BACL|nr:response regulator [Cohnella rhizosphaerae]MDG0809845.1 response regulator [Cohnella rhizosphaerae]
MYNILIIDDERLIAEGVRAKLERAGMSEISEIRVACGGEEGIRAAGTFAPHIVITDMRMPDIDGVQVVRRLSAELPRTKFILLSGYGDYAYVREAFKYGVLDYLLKPAGSAELADQIKAAIAAIEADARQAAMAERSRQTEHLALAARMNALLNDAEGRGAAGELGGKLGGWPGERIGGWPGERIGGWPGERIGGWPGERIGGWLDGRNGGWLDGRNGGQFGGPVGGGSVFEPCPCGGRLVPCRRSFLQLGGFSACGVRAGKPGASTRVARAAQANRFPRWKRTDMRGLQFCGRRTG